MVKKVAENFAVELVPLREIAAVLGSLPETVLALADKEGAKVTERWDGSLCIGSDVARKIREQQEGERARELQLQMEHRTWLADRTARRQAAQKTAHDAELKKALAAQQDYARKINSGEIASEWATGAFPIIGSPDLQAQAKARQAGTQASKEFDQREPELDFYTWKERQVEPNMKAAR